MRTALLVLLTACGGPAFSGATLREEASDSSLDAGLDAPPERDESPAEQPDARPVEAAPGPSDAGDDWGGYCGACAACAELPPSDVTVNDWCATRIGVPSNTVSAWECPTGCCAGRPPRNYFGDGGVIAGCVDVTGASAFPGVNFCCPGRYQ